MEHADPSLCPVEAIVREAEADLAELTTHEVAIVFDKDGRELLRKQGDAAYVTFTPDELDQLKDTIVTHNHPSGRSLSNYDVALAVSRDLAAIRAVGTNDLGERCTYVLTRGASGWEQTRDEVWEIHAQIELQLRREEGEAIFNGELTMAEARRNHRHAIMTRVARRLKWNYQRRVND